MDREGKQQTGSEGESEIEGEGEIRSAAPLAP